jgi:hypothetical protein
MLNHCQARGGGVAVGMVRVDVDSKNTATKRPDLSSGTLRTISNSMQMALRPRDEVTRLDDHSFAIALIYSAEDAFTSNMFERSFTSIHKHTRLMSDRGQALQLSCASWHSSSFDPMPDSQQILNQVESSLKPIEHYQQT